MGAFFGFYRQCIRYAWRDSFSIANAWAGLWGPFILWGFVRWWGYQVILPDTLDVKLLFLLLAFIGATWVGVFIIRFVLAPVILFTEQKNSALILSRQIEEIGAQRSFVFKQPHLTIGSTVLPSWFEITHIDLIFENKSDAMLRYKIKSLSIEINKHSINTSDLGSGGGFISARDTIKYGFDFTSGVRINIPVVILISFVVEYDSVTPIKLRTTEREVRYTYSCFEPMIWNNVIIREAET
jgi:hypothetical protein